MPYTTLLMLPHSGTFGNGLSSASAKVLPQICHVLETRGLMSHLYSKLDQK